MKLITRREKGTLLTFQEMDNNLLFLNNEIQKINNNKIILEGTNYFLVNGNGTHEENAIELQTIYNKAKNNSPSQNKIINIVVAPGVYTFNETKFKVNTPYINIVSLTGNTDVSLNGIKVTTDNIYIKGINCNLDKFELFGIINKCIFENCKGGNDSFNTESVIINSVFKNCLGLDNCFSFGGITLCQFNNCVSENNSFNSKSFMGTVFFKNCDAKINSFFTTENMNYCSFINCEAEQDSFKSINSNILESVFTNCVGGFGSFTGGVSTSTFNNCKGGEGSFFGSGGNATGFFNDCVGGENCFGGENGIVSGIFENCRGYMNSFGCNGVITSTARLYNCRLIGSVFETPEDGGKILNCIDSDDCIVTIN